uniref:NAD(P)/FAD-dependent oxidoreductase n=1 Tax=Roseivirga sp. TaxID=1964215 RepID=UPI0040471B74
MMVDYIIVGQGLAGSILADHLFSEGCKVMVYDDPLLSNSSKIAGGLYNPVTGRKMVKTWKAEPLFNYLVDYYPKLEQSLGAKFLHDIPIYRPFISAEELNEWMGKSADIDYSQFIREVHSSSAYGDQVNDDFGGLLLDKSGYVDTAKLVEASRQSLSEKNLLVKEYFDTTQLKLMGDSASYKNITCKGIIFCNGHKALQEEYFGWIPLKPVKGELLMIKTEEPLKVIHNRGVFVIPQGNGICKVGSTYDHNNLDENPTLEAKNVLMGKLNELVKFPYHIEYQLAGIRPATKDRKPLLGVHPKHKSLMIFNGFGTKGVSLIPYFAHQMTQLLTDSGSIEHDVNIERFFSLT